MRKLAALLGACALSAAFGCAHFIVRDSDSAGIAAAKVAARVLFGIPTLGATEVGIGAAELEESRRGCGVWKDCSLQDAALLGAAIGVMSRPPAPLPPPVYYPVTPVPAARCTTTFIGGTAQTTCW